MAKKRTAKSVKEPLESKARTVSTHGVVALVARGRWYYVRFYDDRGHRRFLGLEMTNKVSATRKAAELDKALQAGKPWEPILGRSPVDGRTFSAAMDEWLEKGCRWSANTRRGHAAIVRQVKAHFGDLPVTEIRSADVEGYLAQRRDEGMPPASRNRILATLKAFFRKVGPPPDGWGWVDLNPAASVRTVREDVTTKDILDDNEMVRLLAELPEADRRVVLTAGDTGMRRSELERLVWGDVDFSAGKGTGEIRVLHTKNGQFRVVPMTSAVRKVLSELKKGMTPHPTAPVFASVTDNRTLRAALKRAKISKAITLHSFRHQFATRALEAGVSSFHLQAIGGWETPVMLERYGKRRNAALHAEMAKLDRPKGGRRVGRQATVAEMSASSR